MELVDMPETIAIIGEAMLELSQDSEGNARLAYGGDTLNTAIYLARLGVQPAYISALGRDPYSQRMLADWREVGIDAAAVLLHETRLPGLYAIQTDESGERRFHYWRSESAMRAFFKLPGAQLALDKAAEARWLYLSGITLSIFQADERHKLIELARLVRAGGGQVIFDPNYRPSGWSSADEARDIFGTMGEIATIALPTRDDEDALYGHGNAEDHITRWHTSGCPLVIMKCGADGAMISDRSGCVETVSTERCHPVDTTGAGDSFNAAFLAALMQGKLLPDAVRAGHRLAAKVIAHPGAIISRHDMPLSG